MTQSDERGTIRLIRRYVRGCSEPGDFVTQELVSGSLSDGATVYLGISRLPAGAVTDEACHSTDEAVFVLSGRNGELVIDSECVGDFGQDDSFLIRSGQRHQYRNVGPDVIEMVFFFPSPERPDVDL